MHELHKSDIHANISSWVHENAHSMDTPPRTIPELSKRAEAPFADDAHLTLSVVAILGSATGTTTPTTPTANLNTIYKEGRAKFITMMQEVHGKKVHKSALAEYTNGRRPLPAYMREILSGMVLYYISGMKDPHSGIVSLARANMDKVRRSLCLTDAKPDSAKNLRDTWAAPLYDIPELSKAFSDKYEGLAPDPYLMDYVKSFLHLYPAYSSARRAEEQIANGVQPNDADLWYYNTAKKMKPQPLQPQHQDDSVTDGAIGEEPRDYLTPEEVQAASAAELYRQHEPPAVDAETADLLKEWEYDENAPTEADTEIDPALQAEIDEILAFSEAERRERFEDG